MNNGAIALVAVILVGGGIAIAYLAKATKPPSSLVAQAPTPAVAGIQALGMLAGKGIDAWIASKANKDDEGD